MNLSGLKRASRQCLRDSRVNPWKLSFLYALCYFGCALLCDGGIYLLNNRMRHETGLSAMAVQGQLEFLSFLISLALTVVSVLWSAGYSWFALCLSRGQEVSFDTLFKGFRTFSRVVLLYLAEMFFVWCWALLFVFPGIVAAYRYRMAIYVLLDDPQVSVLEAIQASKRLTYGHKLELFVMDLSFIWYHLPVALASYLPVLMQMEIASISLNRVGQLTFYWISILVPFLFMTLAMPHVAATEAHAYNCLVSMDRARREEIWGSNFDNSMPWQ